MWGKRRDAVVFSESKAQGNGRPPNVRRKHPRTCASPSERKARQRPLLRQRLIFGTLLAAMCIGLMILDAWLWEQTPPEWIVNGVNLGAWAYHGAISTLLVMVLTWLASRELIAFARIGGYRPLA